MPTDRARGTLIAFKEIAAEEIKPEQSSQYEKPIVVLAGPATFSAAEDFLVAWRNSGRGKIIGEPSGGSTGQPLFFKLPGGGSARVCTKHDTFPDGREWVGKELNPTFGPTEPDNQYARPVGGSWRCDETYVKVKGRWTYLYRAVDKQGRTVDFLLSERLDVAAAKSFFWKATEDYAAPRVITLHSMPTPLRIEPSGH